MIFPELRQATRPRQTAAGHGHGAARYGSTTARSRQTVRYRQGTTQLGSTTIRPTTGKILRVKH